MGIIQFDIGVIPSLSNSNYPDKYISFSKVKENQNIQASKEFAISLDKSIRTHLGHENYNNFQQVFNQDVKTLAVQL